MYFSKIYLNIGFLLQPWIVLKDETQSRMLKFYLKQNELKYYTRTIITRGLYFLNPHCEGQKRFFNIFF
jgi:hypothetical protein